MTARSPRSQSAYTPCPPTWDASAEDRIFEILFDVFGHRKHHATDAAGDQADRRGDPGGSRSNLTFRLPHYDPDYPIYDYNDILDCAEEVPELEALHRWAMVLHNQYPWDRSQAELVEVGQLPDDDYVVVFHPRDQAVRHFLRRLDSRCDARAVARRHGRRSSRSGPTERSTCVSTSP